MHCESQPIIYRSMLKYGWEKHEFSVLKSELTRAESSSIERDLVVFYRKAGMSLNAVPGGFGGYNKPFGKERNIIQFDLEGKRLRLWDWFSDIEDELGFNRSTIGAVCRGQHDSNETLGFMWQFESDYLKGKPLIRRTNLAVLQINDEGEIISRWENMIKTVDGTGIPLRSLIRALDQERGFNFTNGFFWCREREYNDAWVPKKYYKSTPVVAISTQGVAIGRWESSIDAANAVGVNPSFINNTIKDYRGLAAGFIWQTKELFDDGFKKEYLYDMKKNTPKRQGQIKQYRELIDQIDERARESGGGNCFFCGEAIVGQCEHHHLWKRVEDDLIDPENIVRVHPFCHRLYHDAPIKKQPWREGFLERLRIAYPNLYYKEREKENK